MPAIPSDVAFTPTVKAIQTEMGSRDAYAKMEQRRGWQTRVSPDLEAFLAELDMFYFGTSNGQGQPYIQYRGGPPGFLHVIDDRTLGFADFGGNQQYITLGNLADNSKAFIFLMDYANRRRVKLWGRARVVEGDAELEAKTSHPDYRAKVERVILFEIEAWDINCPQHIHRRFPESVIDGLQQRIEELESELSALKANTAHEDS
ncbi:MAG: pyridoxamine 5'-phosphate oxidase family protein [Planctomycetota bacterium]